MRTTHLLRMDCVPEMPDIMLSLFFTLLHVILIKTLLKLIIIITSFYFHFTVEETEVQRGEVTCPISQSQQMTAHAVDSNLGLSVSRTSGVLITLSCYGHAKGSKSCFYNSHSNHKNQCSASLHIQNKALLR